LRLSRRQTILFATVALRLSHRQTILFATLDLRLSRRQTILFATANFEIISPSKNLFKITFSSQLPGKSGKSCPRQDIDILHNETTHTDFSASITFVIVLVDNNLIVN